VRGLKACASVLADGPTSSALISALPLASKAHGLLQNCGAFVCALSAASALHGSSSCSALSFDKDDRRAVEFVTAASNRRAECYGIPMQSLFVTKASRKGPLHWACWLGKDGLQGGAGRCSVATPHRVEALGLIWTATLLLLGRSRSRHAGHGRQHHPCHRHH